MTNYEKLMQILPKGTLAHLIIEKGTYDEEEAYKDALRWLNKEVDASSLDDIADILGLPCTEAE